MDKKEEFESGTKIKRKPSIAARGVKWAKLDGESQENFEKFHIYCMMDPDNRSVTAAMKRHHELSGFEIPPGNGSRIYGKWAAKAKRYRWKERALAFDNHFLMLFAKQAEASERKNAKKWVKRRDGLRETSWGKYTELIDTAEKVLEKAREMLNTPLEELTWKAADIPAMVRAAGSLIEQADKMGRLAAEMETEIMGLKLTDVKLKDLPAEKLMRIQNAETVEEIENIIN